MMVKQRKGDLNLGKYGFAPKMWDLEYIDCLDHKIWDIQVSGS